MGLGINVKCGIEIMNYACVKIVVSKYLDTTHVIIHNVIARDVLYLPQAYLKARVNINIAMNNKEVYIHVSRIIKHTPEYNRI